MLRAAVSHRGRRLAAGELLDATEACPVCGSAAPRRAVFRVQSDPEIRMLACADCHGCSASHMPSPACLAAYYAAYYDDAEHRVTFSGDRRFARHVLRALGGDPFGRRVRILDFGGGDGSLSLQIAAELLARDPERRIEVLVVDYGLPSPSPDERIVVTHRASWEEIGDRYDLAFDLVLASAVLEHIPDLRSLIPALLCAVAPGGLFYARTPYVLPLARLVPRLDLTYPAHVHDLGSGFWNRLTATFGVRARYLASRPSIVATTWTGAPLRTLTAHLLKLPARLEEALSPPGRLDRFWNLVGGWEVALQPAER